MDLENLKHKDLSVIYITSKDCNVCKVIYPKLENLLAKFEKSEFVRLETDDYPQVAGEFMIFSVPAVLIFSNGRELYRAARYLDLQEIEQIITDYYSKIF